VTPTEIEKEAEEVAITCITAFRRLGERNDREMREIIQLHVENALSKAVLGCSAPTSAG